MFILNNFNTSLSLNIFYFKLFILIVVFYIKYFIIYPSCKSYLFWYFKINRIWTYIYFSQFFLKKTVTILRLNMNIEHIFHLLITYIYISHVSPSTHIYLTFFLLDDSSNLEMVEQSCRFLSSFSDLFYPSIENMY